MNSDNFKGVDLLSEIPDKLKNVAKLQVSSQGDDYLFQM